MIPLKPSPHPVSKVLKSCKKKGLTLSGLPYSDYDKLIKWFSKEYPSTEKSLGDIIPLIVTLGSEDAPMVQMELIDVNNVSHVLEITVDAVNHTTRPSELPVVDWLGKLPNDSNVIIKAFKPTEDFDELTDVAVFDIKEKTLNVFETTAAAELSFEFKTQSLYHVLRNRGCYNDDNHVVIPLPVLLAKGQRVKPSDVWKGSKAMCQSNQYKIICNKEK